MNIKAPQTPEIGRGQVPSSARPRVHPGYVPLVSACLFWLYRLPLFRLRQLILWLLHRLEGGTMFSVTLRRIFSVYHGVDVGMYTHGGWVGPFNLGRGTKVGRYCSIAETAYAFTRNHPMDMKSTSALFFNPHFNLVNEDWVPWSPLTIGNDVWIGHNAIILPSVSAIGDGAVIGAGAVVHRNVPPFAVVIGNPSRIVRFRFSESVIRDLIASAWWDKSLEEILPEMEDFLRPLE